MVIANIAAPVNLAAALNVLSDNSVAQTLPRAEAETTAPQPAAKKLSLPERPKLADGVMLAGQMLESAFRDPPWLLEREGAGYIQVTQLLYQIAEQCDGQHTIDEIVDQVSNASGRSITGDNVRLLITKQLVPRGLIEIPGLPEQKVEAGARSPLALNMRVRMIGPEAVSPIASVLRVLYWPPVLIGVLIVTALAEAWIYLIHGVGSSAHDAIYRPGLMVLVLGSIVVGAAFHELGHAAALHYGGGKIKGMGAGIYIVYPAFFTDVSDNYRLRRWARIRTDLGGFYFNLIFALGVLGIYALTGWEVLLIVVVLINLEIIHQLLPFVRLDGYWTLADLTGVPDFFSQMTAFARSVLPFKAGEGRKLPPLKWWAKAVFALYMLITIPLLGVPLLVMVKSVPRVLATAWDSFGKLGQGVMTGFSQGDVLTVIGGVVQILLLSLPIAGLCYTLFSLGKRLIDGVWNWSKPTPGRRIAGSLGVLAAAGLVGFMWAPRLPLGVGGGAPGPMYEQVRFEPILPNERGTIPDGVTGVVATREPTRALLSETTPEATLVPTAEGTPGEFLLRQQAEATIKAQPTQATATAAARSAGSPQPTPVVQQPAVKPPAVKPTVAGSPGTPQPTRVATPTPRP